MINPFVPFTPLPGPVADLWREYLEILQSITPDKPISPRMEFLLRMTFYTGADVARQMFIVRVCEHGREVRVADEVIELFVAELEHFRNAVGIGVEAILSRGEKEPVQ